MRKIAIVCLSMATILAVPTSAAQAKQQRTSCTNAKLLTSYSANYHSVARVHGWRAPGRNIRKWGLSERRQSNCHSIRRSLDVLRRMRMPRRAATLVTTGPPSQPPAGTQTIHAGGTLEAIAQCESGGNPSTDTGNGFHGKYQFTQSTWESVGGTGNPAAASEAEQDKRAAMLYAREGPAPWPVCGYR
jgi:Transglycosylase-like domain